MQRIFRMAPAWRAHLMSFWWWERSPAAFREIKIAALDVPWLVDEEVTRYARMLDFLPPIAVFDVGGDLLVVDGYHRINAARYLGRPTIKAQILRGTWDEACAFAVYTLAAELGVAVEVALDKIRRNAGGGALPTAVRSLCGHR